MRGCSDDQSKLAALEEPVAWSCFCFGEPSKWLPVWQGHERFWRRKWQPTPVFLPGEFHGQRSLVSYSPWGSKELGMTCKELDTTERLPLPLLLWAKLKTGLGRLPRGCNVTLSWILRKIRLENIYLT